MGITLAIVVAPQPQSVRKLSQTGSVSSHQWRVVVTMTGRVVKFHLWLNI